MTAAPEREAVAQLATASLVFFNNVENNVDL
jgi:hypothetical protein